MITGDIEASRAREYKLAQVVMREGVGQKRRDGCRERVIRTHVCSKRLCEIAVRRCANSAYILYRVFFQIVLKRPWERCCLGSTAVAAAAVAGKAAAAGNASNRYCRRAFPTPPILSSSLRATAMGRAAPNGSMAGRRQRRQRRR